ncbi:MAG: ABC transporter permease [Actinomycetota bacterium]
MTAVEPTRPGGSDERVVSARLGIVGQIAEVVRYRELLGGLIRKELKVKYKDSTLGFLWSLLNPALSLAVFYVVFQIFLQAGIPAFSIFLLCGLLVWNLFSASLAGATGSVTSASGLVNKVYFPRVILPLAAVGAAVVHFFLQGIVLVAALAVTRYDIEFSWLPLLVLAFAATVSLGTGFAILLSAVNVYARDTQHILELSLLAWFWLTPIVYPVDLVASQVAERSVPDWLYLINPITPLVMTFQRVLHNRVDFEQEVQLRETGGIEITITRILPDESFLWYVGAGSIVFLIGAALTLVALHVFSRLEGNFAEEL